MLCKSIIDCIEVTSRMIFSTFDENVTVIRFISGFKQNRAMIVKYISKAITISDFLCIKTLNQPKES